MFRSLFAVVLVALATNACTTHLESNPSRTATEQLLLSRAVDDAVRQIDLPLAPGARVFVDTTYFDATDGKYAIGAVRERLLQAGAHMAADRPGADVVVELRSGAASVDKQNTLFGLPSYDVPIPFGGTSFTTPKLALLDMTERKGVAKLAATAHRAGDGGFIAASGPKFGYSHVRQWTVLLLISLRSDDLIPEGARKRSSILPSGP
jgi:hypothetical protein